MKKIDIMPTNIAIFAIGMIDLLSTLFWVYTHRAIEHNPIMAYLLEIHPALFISVKIASLLVFVVVTEYYRRNFSQSFAKKVGVVTIFAYIGIYTVSFTIINKQYLLSLL
ncbi:MAG: DUF5658 family protein [Armatimonadota bacterium]